EVIRQIIDELARSDDWSQKNLKATATLLSTQVGLEPAIVELAAQRFAYGVKPLSEAVIKEQQAIADSFTELKLLPKRIVVRDAVYQPKQ
ncbi:sulfonate ABC transporter substrate-binding protein, partial [Undibacterium sp. LFS511W]|nr:sulfonate ABC transporter substrate-binding protein [Undibacterium luofuense]